MKYGTIVTWIDFLVATNTVSIHNTLESLSEPVGSVKGRDGLSSSQSVQHGRHFTVRFVLKIKSVTTHNGEREISCKILE